MSDFQDTIDWYNQNAMAYVKEISKRMPGKQLTEFVSHLPAKGKVLDAGCAAGRDTAMLSQLGYVVVGIDAAENLIQIARKLHPLLTFKHGTFLHVPYPDAYFDGIWARATLLHLEKLSDVEKALREFNRLLQQGGWLFVSVKAQLDQQKTKRIKESDLSGTRFFRFFTDAELRQLLEKAGFTVEQLKRHKYPPNHIRYRQGVEWIISLSKKVTNLH